MSPFLDRPLLNRITERLHWLYGHDAEKLRNRLVMLIGRYGVGEEVRPVKQRWSEKDVVLITYGDMVTAPPLPPLQALESFLMAHLQGVISTVHILPFFPYSSDDGFSVIDYRQVDPELGKWSDVISIGEKFRLMFDLVLNHCSRQSEWFQEFVRGIAPSRNYFLTADPSHDFSKVVRPRTSPLLEGVQTVHGERHVWTTFSSDQIDLDFSNPDVLFEFLDILMLYVSMGAQIIRLDAIAYLWKREGTGCIHLPDTHEIVKLIRDFLTMVAPEVLVLTETNVPHAENISYFGDGNEAHMVYQFSLPPLLLHGLRTGTAKYLTTWAKGVGEAPEGCTYFNFTASHDGIGVRPLEGIVPQKEINQLGQDVLALGGQISCRTDNNGEELPYELNITYYDAMGETVSDGNSSQKQARFVCSQAVLLALKGMPALYFNSFVAGGNNQQGYEKTGRARTLNRQKWELADLELRLGQKDSQAAQVYHQLTQLIRIRRNTPAFHPDGAMEVFDLNPKVFAFLRTSPDESQTVLCLHNLSGKPVSLNIAGKDQGIPANLNHDLVTAQAIAPSGKLQLNPYQVAWLIHHSPTTAQVG